MHVQYTSTDLTPCVNQRLFLINAHYVPRVHNFEKGTKSDCSASYLAMYPTVNFS